MFREENYFREMFERTHLSSPVEQIGYIFLSRVLVALMPSNFKLNEKTLNTENLTAEIF